MPVATWSLGGESSGTLQDCEKVLSSLEAEADGLLEKFLVTLEHGRKFAPAIEKIDGQLDYVAGKQNAQNELDLNEAVVLAEKLGEELESAHRMADGAALTCMQEEWAADFEEVRASLDRLVSGIGKIREGVNQEGEGVIEARSALILFSREARGCTARLDALKRAFARKDKPHARVAAAKKRVEALRAGLGRSYAKLMRERLRKKVDEAKTEILSFIKNGGTGRIFVDRKHLTLTAGGRKMRVPLTQSVKFSLEEIAPIEEELTKLDRAVVVGSFEQRDGMQLVRIGERSVVGDSVVYSEKSFFLQ